MSEGSSSKWVWWVVAAACVVGAFDPEQALNVLTPRTPAEEVIRAKLGSDARLEDTVRIRPRRLGEPGRGIAFKRTVVCGVAVTRRGRVRVAVIYPLRRSSNSPSMVRADNPGGAEGWFIGSAVLRQCADAQDRRLFRAVGR